MAVHAPYAHVGCVDVCASAGMCAGTCGRMDIDRRPFALRKAACCMIRGHVLEAERLLFANRLIISVLQGDGFRLVRR